MGGEALLTTTAAEVLGGGAVAGTEVVRVPALPWTGLVAVLLGLGGAAAWWLTRDVPLPSTSVWMRSS